MPGLQWTGAFPFSDPDAELDPDVVRWRQRVNANGGAVAWRTLLAANAFARGCKADGLWPLLRRVNLFCGDQLAACLVPLVATAGFATDVNTNFVSGDYSEAIGLTGNGVSKFLDTGYTPVEPVGGLAAYVRADLTAGGKAPIGCRNADSSQLFWLRQSTTPTVDGGYGSGVLASSAGAMTKGFHHTSRVSGTDLRRYLNGVEVASNTGSASPTDPANAIAVFAFRFGAASIGGYIAVPLGGYVIDAGLSPTQAAALNARMQAFQAALGRAV